MAAVSVQAPPLAAQCQRFRAGKEDWRSADFPDTTSHPAQGFCPIRPRAICLSGERDGHSRSCSLLTGCNISKGKRAIVPEPYPDSEGEEPGLMIQEPK